MIRVTGKAKSKTSSTTRAKISNNSPGPFLVSHSLPSLVLVLVLLLSLRPACFILFIVASFLCLAIDGLFT